MAKGNSGHIERSKEYSKLLIKWHDANSESFAERTDTHDINDSGISFYLRTPIWVDTHLTITVGFSDRFGRLQCISGKVVRIQVDAEGRQLVAARFD